MPCLLQCDHSGGCQEDLYADDSFWNDDPVDKDHSRKKRILHDARIEVNAPFHPAFKPTEQIMVPKRKSSRKPVARARDSAEDLFENKK